ncbi:hypothetical protein G6F57_019455 [Rhizopus arrhizus]|nr:hypothetical protein G6F65_013821 [Rhizopus arrhizus]KAG1439344.1 hypothetical protein G6F57_019455 [Rhizopus arrhizus]
MALDDHFSMRGALIPRLFTASNFLFTDALAGRTALSSEAPDFGPVGGKRAMGTQTSCILCKCPGAPTIPKQGASIHDRGCPLPQKPLRTDVRPWLNARSKHASNAAMSRLRP